MAFSIVKVTGTMATAMAVVFATEICSREKRGLYLFQYLFLKLKIFSCRTESTAALGTAFLNLHNLHLRDVSKLLDFAEATILKC